MISNSLSQDTEITLLSKLTPYLDSKNFIDIGAEKGVFSKTLLQHGLSGTLFEPMPKHLPTLKNIVEQYPNTTLHTCAITNIDGKQQFNIATNADGIELDFYHSLQKANAPGVFEHSKSFEVECRSLQSLLENKEISSTLGILKTDTEGNDLNVLYGLGAMRPELVICEYFSEGLYDGWTDGGPEPIIKFMASIGYSSFLATKRKGNLEFINVGMAMFRPKQWGNLFFFREDFFVKVNTVIAEFLLNNEESICEKFDQMNSALEEKEKVIQQLLTDKQMQTLGNNRQCWLPRIFKIKK